MADGFNLPVEKAKQVSGQEARLDPDSANDAFSRNTRAQLKQLIEAVNQLMAPPDPPRRPIGFINPEDKGKKTSGARGKT